MKREKIVEILGEEADSDVLRLPNRQYPGILIQGDSLISLVSSAKDAIEFFEEDKEEALAALTNIFEELNWRFENYKKVL